MKKKLVLCLLLWFSGAATAQENRVYTWEEALSAPKDSVCQIDASRQKWKSVPPELYTFTKLQKLDLTKNSIAYLSDSIKMLTRLTDLDLTKNQLQNFPVQLCGMKSLKRLTFGRNYISGLPECIEYLVNLEYLDLSDNPIAQLPHQLTKLTKLKKADFRGILFSAKFQEEWRTKMPDTQWIFDYPCKCME